MNKLLTRQYEVAKLMDGRYAVAVRNIDFDKVEVPGTDYYSEWQVYADTAHEDEAYVRQAVLLLGKLEIPAGHKIEEILYFSGV